MTLVEKLVGLIRVVEGQDDAGKVIWFVGIEFDPEHGLFDRCNDENHARLVCRALQLAAKRFVENVCTGRLSCEAAEAAEGEQ